MCASSPLLASKRCASVAARLGCDLLPRVEVERAVAGSGRAGRAAGRRRSHWGGGGAEGRVGGAEAGSQGADGGHGGCRCAAETGHGLRQLTGHLAGRDVGVEWGVKSVFFFCSFISHACVNSEHPTEMGFTMWGL